MIMSIVEDVGKNVDFSYLELYLSFIEDLSYGPVIGLCDKKTEIVTMDPRNRWLIHSFRKV